jgi:flagellar motility protein MotE (MotC chaperone)
MRKISRQPIALLKVIGWLIFLFFSANSLVAFAEEPVKATPEMVELAASLKKREEAVAARELEINRRSRELTALELDVKEKLERLVKMQDDVQKKLDYIDSLEVRDKEFRNLVKVYSAMSATKLAPLLNEMKDGNVAKILRAMKTEEVAKVIPKLDKDKAVRVSRILGMID